MTSEDVASLGVLLASGDGDPPGGPPVADVIGHLQRLVRLRTVNPPGDEYLGVRDLEATFRAHGIPYEVAGPDQNRLSIIATIPGTDKDADGILLLSHLDVVDADATTWSVDPFGGVVADDQVWGRGVLDCKGLTAIWLAFFLHVQGSGMRPRRDIVFCATADEEAGGRNGVAWLLEHRPHWFASRYCLNEGGGASVEIGGSRFLTYQVGEQGRCRVTLTVAGQGGHASIPVRDNALFLLAGALLSTRDVAIDSAFAPSARMLLERLSLALNTPEREQLLAHLGERPSIETVKSLFGGELHLARWVAATSMTTLTPTIVSAGQQLNVIPELATAAFDCRFMPGVNAEAIERAIRDQLAERLGEDESRVRITISDWTDASDSPAESELQRCMQRAALRHAPQAAFVPYVATGGSDSRFLRRNGDRVVYGFFPMLPEVDRASVHGVNERVPIRSLAFSTQLLWDVLDDFAIRTPTSSGLGAATSSPIQGEPA